MKRKEFGSNFYEELKVSDLILEDTDSYFFFDSGRSALRYLLNHIETNFSKVLLPEYTCQSVIEPFLECGYNIGYYPVNRNFKVEREVFIDIVTREKPQMIFVQTYFGIDTFMEVRTYLRELQENGTIVVEDITHSLFSKQIWGGERTDYIVGSLRKWCSIPDGGVLVVQNKKRKKYLKPLELKENNSYVKMRLEAQKKKRQYFESNDVDNWDEKKIFIQLYDDSEKILDMERSYYTMSQYTRKRIYSINRIKLMNSRQKNYLQIKNAFESQSIIEVINLQIENDIVPLYCPIYVHKNFRDILRANLQQRNVMCPVIWPKPSNLCIELDSEVEWIYSHILAIPCDQRYGAENMNEIVKIIKRSIKELQIMFLDKGKIEEFEEYYSIKCDDFNIYWTAENYNKPPRENLWAFYQKCIENLDYKKNKEIYFIKDESATIVGYLYLDFTKEMAEISLALKKEFTGQGYGRKAIMQAMEIAKSRGYKRMIGKVREDNIASMKAHQACGYIQSDEYITFYSDILKKDIKMCFLYNDLI